jgi:DNA topoisomerase VI subunit B
MCTDATNAKHEMYNHTGNNRSQRNRNKRLKKNLESIAKKIDTFTTKDNREHNTQYGKYCSLKLEAWAVGITAGSREEVPGRKGL